MCRLLPLLAILISAVGSTQPLLGEGWEFVPVGTADVVDLQVFSDGTVLAATKGGPQVSRDGGTTWGHWLTTSTVSAIAFSPGHALFIGQDSFSWYDSVAVGSVAAWQSRAMTPDRGNLASMAFGGKAEPGARTTTIIADSTGRAWAAVGSVVLHYPGYGTEWTFAPLPVTSVLDLHFGSTGHVWAATTDGVFSASSDGYVDSSTWTQEEGLAGITFTAVIEASDGQVWAGTAGGSLYQRPAGDTSWTRMDVAPSAVLSLTSTSATDPMTGGSTKVVLVGTALDGAFRSVDGGATWHPAGLPGGIAALAARPFTAEVWAAVEHDGLRRSLDGGQTWSPIRWSNVDLEHVVAASPRTGGALVAGDRGPHGLFAYSRTTDSWRYSGLGRSSEHPYRSIVDVAASPDGRFYALVHDATLHAAGAQTTASDQTNGMYRIGGSDILNGTHNRNASLRPNTLLYRSEDGGANWRLIHVFALRGPFPWGLPRVLVAGPNGVLLVGTRRSGEAEDPDARAALLLSSDAGETWEEVAQMDAYQVTSIAFGPGSAVYAGTGFDAPTAYRSLDGGVSWTELGPVATGDDRYQTVQSLAVSADGSVVAGLNAGGAFRSTDRGQTWEMVLESGYVSEMETSGLSQIFATGGSDVYRSLNSGATWSSVGLNRYYIDAIALSLDGRAYAVARGDLYRTTDIVVTSEQEPELSQIRLDAYPNPSKGEVTVFLSQPRYGPASVAIYDALGRQVSVLHDGTLEAGIYRLRFDGRTLAAGIYVVRANENLQGEASSSVRISVIR